jgi:ABC-2 type transport system ATP-binding protein
MAAVIRTEKLTKFYGSHRGIVDVDLTVDKGEVFGFLGPNGAGKTTTIRLLLDLIRPSSGKAYVFEIESSADPSAIHRRIGYLPGEFALYDRLTGSQTLEYFGNLRGGVDRAYQASLIERFDLDPTRRYREYSKGNKQKVGLVAALQHRPELLMLDEPTSGLDPLGVRDARDWIQAARGDGRTLLISSHVLTEVERICDHLVILQRGRVAASGAIDELVRAGESLEDAFVRIVRGDGATPAEGAEA